MTLFKIVLLLWLLPTLTFLVVAIAAHPAILFRRMLRRLSRRQSGEVGEPLGQAVDFGT